MKKLFIFQDIDDFDFQDKLSGEINRVHALVSLNELLNIEEGSPLPLRQLYQGNERINDLEELSNDYNNLFETDRKGSITLKESKYTPTLRAFLNYEKRIIKKGDTDVENIESQRIELINEAKMKIGELFEKLMSKILRQEINQENKSYRLNQEKDLAKITDDYPSDFKEWAKEYIKSHHALIIKPDFIFKNGDFMEVKRGKAFNAPHNKNQIYKMLLYRILSRQNINIQILSLHPAKEEEKVEGIEYLYFFDST